MVKIRYLSEVSPEERVHLLRRAQTDIDRVRPVVSEIVQGVRESGDKALLRYVQEFDFHSRPFSSLRVSDAELSSASSQLSEDVLDAINRAYTNILAFHRHQVPLPLWFSEVERGVFAGERVTPIHRIGLYVPGGKGFFPSVMLMLGVPAKIAGVKQVAVCTPPREDGSVDPAVLVAAQLCGITEIYKMAGAHAIAAFAFGTTTVPKVDKILGPCSIYAAAAKQMVSHVIDVGLPAGPSESILLADESADPHSLGLDLLIEAEHGADSAATLVTHDAGLARKVVEQVVSNILLLPEPRRRYCETVFNSFGGVLITKNLAESISFVNQYAPEHLELVVKDPFSVLWEIHNAGEILLGPRTPISIANYCLGVNAILPTGGFARSYSCVSVHDFLKRTGIAYLGPAGYQALRHTTEVLANYEGFPAHAMAVSEDRS